MYAANTRDCRAAGIALAGRPPKPKPRSAEERLSLAGAERMYGFRGRETEVSLAGASIAVEIGCPRLASASVFYV